MTADQISELHLLLERYYECLSSPEEEARLADLLANPELPREFAADAQLFAETSAAQLGEEEIEVPADLEERVLASTCGVQTRKPFRWRRIAAWGAAACVTAVGVGLLFSVDKGGGNILLADVQKPDTIIIAERVVAESPVQMEVSTPADAPVEKTAPAPRKRRLAAAAPKAVEIQQGHVREVTDTIEAKRLLAEAFALMGSTMEAAQSSLAVADETLAETTEYLQIANIILR